MAPETSTADQSLKDSSSYQSPYPKFRGWALIATPLGPSMTASPVTVNDCVSRVSAFPICRRHSGEFGDIRLQGRSRSADRTQSPMRVSRKREYVGIRPE